MMSHIWEYKCYPFHLAWQLRIHADIPTAVQGSTMAHALKSYVKHWYHSLWAWGMIGRHYHHAPTPHANTIQNTLHLQLCEVYSITACLTYVSTAIKIQIMVFLAVMTCKSCRYITSVHKQRLQCHVFNPDLQVMNVSVSLSTCTLWAVWSSIPHLKV
jgi:hypothetical protein